MNVNFDTFNQLKKDIGVEAIPLILGQFQVELRERSDLLRDAIVMGSQEALKLQGHSIKSTARTVGLDQVADCAADLESAAVAGNIEESRKVADRLLPLLDLAIDCLHQLESG